MSRQPMGEGVRTPTPIVTLGAPKEIDGVPLVAVFRANQSEFVVVSPLGSDRYSVRIIAAAGGGLRVTDGVAMSEYREAISYAAGLAKSRS